MSSEHLRSPLLIYMESQRLNDGPATVGKSHILQAPYVEPIACSDPLSDAQGLGSCFPDICQPASLSLSLGPRATRGHSQSHLLFFSIRWVFRRPVARNPSSVLDQVPGVGVASAPAGHQPAGCQLHPIPGVRHQWGAPLQHEPAGVHPGGGHRGAAALQQPAAPQVER